MRLLALTLVPLLCFSITLKEALKRSLKENTLVKVNYYELKKVEQKIRETRASLLPSLSFEASYIYWDKNLISQFQVQKQWRWSLTLTQTLFSKSVLDALRVAHKTLNLQKLIFEEVRDTVSVQTAKFFYSLIFKREVLKEKEENLKYWKENLKLIEQMYKNGMASEMDLLRVRSQLLRAKVELDMARIDYEKSLSSFSNFINFKVKEVEGSLEPLPFYVKEPQERLLRENKELKIERLKLSLYEEKETFERSFYYPQLFLFVSYLGFNYKDFSTKNIPGVGPVPTFVEKSKSGYQMGLKLTMNLFDGFKRESRVAYASLDVLKERENLKDLKRKLLTKLKSALKELKSLKEQIKANELLLKSSKKALEMVKERYKLGGASLIDLLEARKSFEGAKVLYLQTILRYNFLVLDLKKMLSLKLIPDL